MSAVLELICWEVTVGCRFTNEASVREFDSEREAFAAAMDVLREEGGAWLEAVQGGQGAPRRWEALDKFVSIQEAA